MFIVKQKQNKKNPIYWFRLERSLWTSVTNPECSWNTWWCDSVKSAIGPYPALMMCQPLDDLLLSHPSDRWRISPSTRHPPSLQHPLFTSPWPLTLQHAIQVCVVLKSTGYYRSKGRCLFCSRNEALSDGRKGHAVIFLSVRFSLSSHSVFHMYTHFTTPHCTPLYYYTTNGSALLVQCGSEWWAVVVLEVKHVNVCAL